MDRYEYNIKSDQIKKLYGKKDYVTIAEIADTIEWNRVKSNSMLTMVADAYEGSRQFDKARDILEIAYERAPLGRQLAYRLTILSLRMKDFVSADEYYQDFVEIAPRDVAQYILKYRIARAKGEDISNLISILEAYVDVEMDERWQYELAKLYHENEEKDKCIAMCDKIILWFAEGKYVTKAMELKMKYEPLTEEQQAKYDGKWDYYNERIKAEAAAYSNIDEPLESESESDSQENEDANTDDTNAEGVQTDDDEAENAVENAVENVSEDVQATVQAQQSASEQAQPQATEEKPWDNMNDIINDTTALDYLTDYSEEEKLNILEEPEENYDEAASAVEEQLAKIVSESMEEAMNEFKLEENSVEESVAKPAEESEIESQEEFLSETEEESETQFDADSDSETDDETASESKEIDEFETPENAYIKPLLADDEETIDEMDDTELVARAVSDEEFLDDTIDEFDEEDDEEDEDEESTEEEDGEDADNISQDGGEVEQLENSTIVPDNDKIEIFEFNESENVNARNIGEELTKTAEIDIDEINFKVKQYDENVYNTANIQAALAQSMKIIMRAESEKATRNAFAEADTLDEPTKRIDIKKDTEAIEPVKENDGKPVYETVPLQPIYNKGEDGQIYLIEPEKEEMQVEGQMGFEEVLEELENIKKEALEEAGRKETIAIEAAKKAAAEVAAAKEMVARAIAEEAEARKVIENAANIPGEISAAVQSEAVSETLTEIPSVEGLMPADNVEIKAEPSAVEPTAVEPTAVEPTAVEPTAVEPSAVEPTAVEPAAVEPAATETMDALNQLMDELEGESTFEETPELEEASANEEDLYDTDEICSDDEDDVATEEQQEEEYTGKQLSEENKKVFVDFIETREMENDIAEVLENLIDGFVKDGTSKTNNLIVMGDAKTGKTSLALGVIKVANKGRGRNGRKVAKVKATVLNKKGITAAMSQIMGTDLVIEQAGNLMPGTVVDMIAAMKLYTDEMIIVLEDDRAAIERLLETNPVLETMFNNKLCIREFTIDDYVKIAKEYAQEQNYVIDEMGTLALFAKIDDINGKNQGITKEEIEEIIDDAIIHADRFKISKLIGKIKRTRYEMGVLKEEDFS